MELQRAKRLHLRTSLVPEEARRQICSDTRNQNDTYTSNVTTPNYSLVRLHNVHKSERILRRKATKRHIPAGCHSGLRPYFTMEAARLADQGYALRINDPTNPQCKKCIIRQAHKLSKTGENCFTNHQVSQAIKGTNPSKDLGPNNLSPIMLKHLGPNANAYLTCG